MRILAAVMCLVLAGGVASAAAQERQFGAKAGPSLGVLALAADEPGEDYDRRIAVAGGGFAVLPVRRHIAIQIEALFNPKGAKLEDVDLGATATLLLDYLEFPVLARIHGPATGPLHFFGGPYVGIRVGATRQIASSGPGFTAGSRENMGDEVERMDVGLVAGAGIDRGRRLVIDGRYAWGLATVNSDTSDGLRFHHRVLTIMAGFRF